MKRALLIVVAVVGFLAITVLATRWLGNDTAERADVERLLQAQLDGDPNAMLDILRCPDEPCRDLVRGNAARLRAPGELKIALYQSQTAHALASRTRTTRVVWFTRPDETVVQCVLVRRQGNVLAGTSVSLLRLSAPLIDRESGCP